MTVCLPATCADASGTASKAVIVASDRMVTYGILVEFEHEVSKSIPINDHAVALQAGDAVAAGAIIRSAIAAPRTEVGSIE